MVDILKYIKTTDTDPSRGIQTGGGIEELAIRRHLDKSWMKFIAPMGGKKGVKDNIILPTKDKELSSPLFTVRRDQPDDKDQADQRCQ
jgi:hypothetical protein